MAKLYAGVEMRESLWVCVLGTGPDDLHHRVELPTTSPTETSSRLLSFFRSHPSPLAIGFISLGQIDADCDSATWGHVTSREVGWQETPVGVTLRDDLGLSVALNSAPNAAALVEHTWGAGRDLPSLCSPCVGDDTRAALVLDDDLFRRCGPSLDTGHLLVPHDWARDSFAGACSGHGDCWIGLASARAVEERWGFSLSELDEHHPAWELEARYLALGILSIVLVASPHRIVLDGDIVQSASVLPGIGTQLRELNNGHLDTPMLAERVGDYIVAPHLGKDSAVLGALALAQKLRY